MIKVLLVDDHELVRMGMSRMLSDVGDITVVGEACNGEEALTQAKKLKPNVVLMDVQMPGIGGIEATRKLAHSFPQVAILVVTICEEEPFPSRILKAGALGYITKGTGLEEMVLAIHCRSQSVRLRNARWFYLANQKRGLAACLSRSRVVTPTEHTNRLRFLPRQTSHEN